MAGRSNRSVAVLGDGPAGSTVATLLARAGTRVALFSGGRPPSPLVGESLLPGVIPVLRELQVEDEVSAYSEYKPGATFVLPDGSVIAFHFGDSAGRFPGYAYNVPRKRFDETLLAAASSAGVRIFPMRARIARAPGDSDRVRLLDPPDEVADYFQGEPDLIIDATGRRRTIARLLDLPARAGDRRDVALFAHYDGIHVDSPGHVHMDHLERGWCWRIPLPQAVSLGIVLQAEGLSDRGASPEAQFAARIAAEPHLRNIAGRAERVSPVRRFNNYQLVAERAVGRGWALVGDSLGFVDPIFSSGLFLAMDGGRALATALLDGSATAMLRYQRRQIRQLAAWQRVVGYYYDGSLFELVRQSRRGSSGRIGTAFNRHVTVNISRILTGESTTGIYAPRLLSFLVRNGLDQAARNELRIR